MTADMRAGWRAGASDRSANRRYAATENPYLSADWSLGYPRNITARDQAAADAWASGYITGWDAGVDDD